MNIQLYNRDQRLAEGIYDADRERVRQAIILEREILKDCRINIFKTFRHK